MLATPRLVLKAAGTDTLDLAAGHRLDELARCLGAHVAADWLPRFDDY